jgi:DNA-directed RNA polymerase subunit RPC12/RpoP
MSNEKYKCPHCKHEFWANRFEQVVCPKCGKVIKK